MEIKDIINELNELFESDSMTEYFEGWDEGICTPEELKNEALELVRDYDYSELYHATFKYMGDLLTKEEYVMLKEKYIKLFDVELVPFPDCCEELDEKWGL